MLPWFGLFRLSLANLRVNKLRSLLTIIGMIFGTGAVIATLSSNEGAARFVRQELQKLGANNVTVRAEVPGEAFTAGDHALVEKYSDVFRSVDRMLEIAGAQARFESRVGPVRAAGAQAGYFAATESHLSTGRFFDTYEETSFAFVAVIGNQAREALFGQKPAIGEYAYLFLGDVPIPFRIVGVLKEKGGPTGTATDLGFFIPYPLAVKLAPQRALSASLVTALHREQDADKAKLQLATLLRARFPNGVRVSDAKEAIERNRMIWEKQNLVGICLALISLLTGGVGIMNIMLLSITQRRKEIGLRKAVGATDAHILAQFLFEAVTVCLIGGVLGVGAGLLFGQRVAMMMGQWEAVVSLTTIGWALFSALFIGVTFGLMPAHRAARLDPYEALRA